jgi:hypothetical protein
MSTPPVGTWTWQAILIVAVPLIGVMLGIAWYVGWSGRAAARVVGVVFAVAALGASGPAVDNLVQARLDSWTRGTGAFICILPGYVVWAPAAASLLCLSALLLLSKRKTGRGAP